MLVEMTTTALWTDLDQHWWINHNSAEGHCMTSFNVIGTFPTDVE
jgi:hypothetical protein